VYQQNAQAKHANSTPTTKPKDKQVGNYVASLFRLLGAQLLHATRNQLQRGGDSLSRNQIRDFVERKSALKIASKIGGAVKVS